MAQDAGRGETFEDTGELDVGRGTRRVWLVKMPAFILDAWKNAPPDAELGRVRVTPKGNTTEVSSLFLVWKRTHAHRLEVLHDTHWAIVGQPAQGVSS